MADINLLFLQVLTPLSYSVEFALMNFQNMHLSLNVVPKHKSTTSSGAQPMK